MASFADLSMSFSSDEAYATGDNFNAGDSIGVGFVACPGTCWSNYRFITQNWNPIYFSAAGSWNTSKWSFTSADDGQAASYTAAYQNVNASTADAVFEKNGMGGNATVTVTSGVYCQLAELRHRLDDGQLHAHHQQQLQDYLDRRRRDQRGVRYEPGMGPRGRRHQRGRRHRHDRLRAGRFPRHV